MTSFITIIPARFESNRLPGKPLVEINGKPMVVHVMEKAQASGADRVIVATDHPDIVDVVERVGGEVCLTRPDHQSGTERLVEVINYYNFSYEQIIVNLQGDEPLIPPKMIRQVADNLSDTEASMTTLAMPITTAKDALNPNVVKVVTNRYGYALYFSRAAIPWKSEDLKHSHKQIFMPLLRHIGIYAYHADFIRRYVSWLPSPLEKIELLEQLRVLWYGEKIYVAKVNTTSILGVDTQEDLDQIRLLQQKS